MSYIVVVFLSCEFRKAKENTTTQKHDNTTTQKLKTRQLQHDNSKTNNTITQKLFFKYQIDR